MKLRNILLLSIVVLGMAAVSCKKDDDSVTKPNLTGMYFDVIPYLRVGEPVKITPLNVTHPEGKEVGYYWQVDSEAKDTVKKETTPGPVDISKTFKFNEVGVHTIYCAAFADGYYSTTYSRTVRVVDPHLEGMVKETGISSSDAHITDSRDMAGENDYYYVHIGSLDWMRNNLAYTGSGVAYCDSDVTSYPLGRYFNWSDAQTACPAGWRLPTLAEWKSLGTDAGALMADAIVMGEKIWEFWPQVKITDAYQLAVIPSGYAIVGASSNTYKGFGSYAAFWTADECDGDAEKANYLYIHEEEPYVLYGEGDKESFAVSVRCVR